MGTSGHYSNYSCSFLPQPPAYSKGKLVRSLRKISPDCLHRSNSSFTPGAGQGGGCGDGRKYSWSSPGESQRRMRWQNPGVSPHPAPRLPKPRQRPPAGSAPSAGTTLALTFPCSAGRGQSGFQRTFQVRGCGARGSALRWVSTRKLVTRSRRVRSLSRAPHSCVREAACPWKGALLGGTVKPVSPTSHPSARSRAQRRESLPRRAALPRTSAELGSRSPRACVGAAHSGGAPPFPWIPPAAPAALTCPGGAHTEPYN